MKKTVVFLAVAILIFLCGCSGNSYLTIDGKSVEPEWVLKIDDFEIGLEEYRYYFLNLKRGAGLSDEEWTDEAEEQLRSDAVEYILVNYAVEKYTAQMGVALDDSDMEKVEKEIAKMIKDCGDKKKYRETLASNYMTEDIYRMLVTSSFLQKKLNDVIFNGDGVHALSEESIREKIDNEYIRVRYLMLKHGDGKQEQAESLLARIRAGEDFVNLVNSEGEESTMNGNPDGIYFREGMVEEGFYDVVSALEINAISDVYNGVDGYYIIKRLPLEQAYIDENIENFIDLEKQNIFSAEVGAIADAMKIEYCDVYEQITTKTLK